MHRCISVGHAGRHLRTTICHLQEGELSLGGNTPAQLGVPTWRSLVAYIPQGKPTSQNCPAGLLTAAQSFRAQQARGRNAHDSHADLVRIAARLCLAEATLNQQWASLSGGEAQRALLAVHLTLRPAVLLLDEPTSACDPDSAARVEEELRKGDTGLLWVSQ